MYVKRNRMTGGKSAMRVKRAQEADAILWADDGRDGMEAELSDGSTVSVFETSDMDYCWELYSPSGEYVDSKRHFMSLEQAMSNFERKFGLYRMASRRKPVRAMRRRATGSPDEMGGGANVVEPLREDFDELSDDLSTDKPLNGGADADNADYQPDKAREKAMEARRRRRAMKKRAATANELIGRAIDKVDAGAPYGSRDAVIDAVEDAAIDSVFTLDDMLELVKYYCNDDEAIAELYMDGFVADIEQALDLEALIGAGRWTVGGRANGRKRGNMYVKRNAGKNRRAKKASMRRTASLAAESLAEDIVNDGPYADEGELYDAIMDAVDRSLIYSYDVWNIAQEYCSDGDIAELFADDYADDVYNEVYKHDMSELIKGDEGEVEARRRRARKAKQTRHSFRKRAQEADEDEDGDLPEFLEEDDDDDDEGDEEEPKDEPEDEEPAEEPEEDREARRAAVRKAMKAARDKVQKGARRVDEPEKNKPQMRQPVRVQRRSANVAGKPAATYDDTCLFM